jgi:Glycosyltransferase sugar-binding region containing DXD motif/Alpha 1,4-glycosyltransferase conserved region
MQGQSHICTHFTTSSGYRWWFSNFHRPVMRYKYVIAITALMLGTMVLFVPTITYDDHNSQSIQQQSPSIHMETNEKVPFTTKQLTTTKAKLVFHVAFTVNSFSTLNLRCIESIFYFHPDAQLKLHSNAEVGIHTTTNEALPSAIQLLINRGYQIDIVPYRAADILQQAVRLKNSIVNTTAADIWSSQLETKWKHETFWYSNESNLLRLCLLYTEGGIYLDTDVILVRPIVVVDETIDPYDGLNVDNVMAHDGKSYHCAVMKFLQKGNMFLGTAINNFLDNYNGNDWGNNGPRVFRRTSKDHPELICSDLLDASVATAATNEIVPSNTKTESGSCWMQPLPSESFQPVPWREWSTYCFQHNKSPIGAVAQQIITAPGVYAIHFNNHITGVGIETQAYVNGSVCDFALSNFCILCTVVEQPA